jgi:3D (Asp-Asp-Asp) domain-containing protein
VLTAALAVVALPGLAGSRVTDPIEPIPASAFQQLSSPAKTRSSVSVGFDGAHVSANSLTAATRIVERGAPQDPAPNARFALDQPDPGAGSARKPAHYTLTGEATFYDNGTTAMRLPRGTVVVICGNGGCIERVVNDYGPVKKSRVVDLYRPDFFAICGCQWFAGITQVTVYVY